jgi:hypothetical protein
MVLALRGDAEGSSRSGTDKVWHHLSHLAARGSKASPKTLRRVGPKHAEDYGLRAHVDQTAARKE